MKVTVEKEPLTSSSEWHCPGCTGPMHAMGGGRGFRCLCCGHEFKIHYLR